MHRYSTKTLPSTTTRISSPSTFHTTLLSNLANRPLPQSRSWMTSRITLECRLKICLRATMARIGRRGTVRNTNASRYVSPWLHRQFPPTYLDFVRYLHASLFPPTICFCAVFCHAQKLLDPLSNSIARSTSSSALIGKTKAPPSATGISTSQPTRHN